MIVIIAVVVFSGCIKKSIIPQDEINSASNLDIEDNLVKEELGNKSGTDAINVDKTEELIKYTEDGEVDTSGWAEYENSELEIKLLYPPSWAANERAEYNRVSFNILGQKKNDEPPGYNDVIKIQRLSSDALELEYFYGIVKKEKIESQNINIGSATGTKYINFPFRQDAMGSPLGHSDLIHIEHLDNVYQIETIKDIDSAIKDDNSAFGVNYVDVIDQRVIDRLLASIQFAVISKNQKKETWSKFIDEDFVFSFDYPSHWDYKIRGDQIRVVSFKSQAKPAELTIRVPDLGMALETWDLVQEDRIESNVRGLSYRISKYSNTYDGQPKLLYMLWPVIDESEHYDFGGFQIPTFSLGLYEENEDDYYEKVLNKLINTFKFTIKN